MNVHTSLNSRTSLKTFEACIPLDYASSYISPLHSVLTKMYATAFCTILCEYISYKGMIVLLLMISEPGRMESILLNCFGISNRRSFLSNWVSKCLIRPLSITECISYESLNSLVSGLIWKEVWSGLQLNTKIQFPCSAFM